MARRQDIHSICIIGSGPIVIGQACEFDYSGTQAARVLKEEGFRIVLVNSNPATIMTDPEVADATYIEPLTKEFLKLILEKEKPDAILPTVGGQTALNLALELHEEGTLIELGIEMIGVRPEVIDRAENREQFAKIMEGLNIDQPKAGIARSLEDGMKIVERVGYPVILRPSFTMGGSGGNIAYNASEFDEYLRSALLQSPTSEVLLDESLIGWKEFELELMRDKNDNVVIICSIENIDPLGIHTGDSITVAPIQTLSDVEYQGMRDDAIRIIRAVGVETGGCNIQFATDPETGRRVVIEMNPRVSRSSALASKATGYPIAKISALLAVGYSLDEIQNDITGKTTAAFEPVLDYIVTKIPRFAFEKFPGEPDSLTTQMKSVGEVMSIGRTFCESFSKAVSSLEVDAFGLATSLTSNGEDLADFYRAPLRLATSKRMFHLFDALREGLALDTIFEMTGIDPWFLSQFRRIVENEKKLIEDCSAGLKEAKNLGRNDREIGALVGQSANEIRALRKTLGIEPVFKQVDTCAGEFSARTSYFYSTFERGNNEAAPLGENTVVILGGGPNRIGQGIEFDYCAVHGAMALRKQGYQVVMVNCNPETVSTDYDISDRLYFEPLTVETVSAIIDLERPLGVILQFGGQTPLRLADALEQRGVKILGTPTDIIDLTEDRERFNRLIKELDLLQPPAGLATKLEQAVDISKDLGFPILVRPSYVLGGRGMQIVYDEGELRSHFSIAQSLSKSNDDAPVLLDRFLNDAIEVDVDCVCDGKRAVIGGILEHIEEAGVHSGDSACVLPPFNLPESVLRQIRAQTQSIALKLGVVGLMNVQYAVQEHRIFILEVNPRASRTVPFISKSIGVPLAGIAARIMVGESLDDIGFVDEVVPVHYAVKQSVFPFNKFPDVDTILGPEMRSTGEVMGIDADYFSAFIKAQYGASNQGSSAGTAFISVRNADKWAVVPIAKGLASIGFNLVATRGTAAYLKQNDIDVVAINKVKEGQPHIVDAIINGNITFVVNTTVGAQSIADSRSIRRETLTRRVPYYTTIAGANAAMRAMAEMDGNNFEVRSIQSFHGDVVSARLEL